MWNRACHAVALSLPNGRRRAPLDETQRPFTKDHPIIVPLTVRNGERPEILRGNR